MNKILAIISPFLFSSMLFASGGLQKPPSISQPIKILILGDSLTEGVGVQKEHAFPALLETSLNADGRSVQVINGGVSGATTASGMSRLKWHLKARPQIVVIALGANDGLRGFKPEATRKNLEELIKHSMASGCKVVLAGMMVPPNYGPDFSKNFAAIFPDLAKKYRIPLIPFLLEGVGGVPALNMPDGIHPNEKGHVLLEKTVRPFILPLL